MSQPDAWTAGSHAPVLSVVIAVHGDQAYLEGAARSVLAHGRHDVELVVVDNGSRDHVPEVLRELAERDDRVVPLRLDEPVALGSARAQGIEVARGSYVWLMDATDVLTPDAVATVIRRVAASAVEVLLVGYLSGGSVALIPSPTATLLRRLAGGEPTDVATRPSILDAAAAPWSLVVARTLLEREGLTPRGQRQEVGYAFCALLAAATVSAEPGVLYHRRRPRNASASPDVLGDDAEPVREFEQVFTFLDERPALAPRRRFVTGRMVAMGTTQLNRLPAPRRRPFIEQLLAIVGPRTDALDAWPAGRVSALRKRLTRGRRTSAYLALESLLRVLRSFSGWRRKRSRGAHAQMRRVAGSWRLFEYRLWRMLPLRPDLAAYAAYWYRGYSCNPRAIYEKARELAPGVRGVWIVPPDARLPEGVDHVVAGTRAYYRLLARATYFVNNVGFPDHWVKRPGTVLVHTHHGTPLKRMGLDQYDGGGRQQRPVPPRHFARWARWDYSLSSNLLSTLVWERVYPASYTTLEYGYPRNDRLVKATEHDIVAIRDALGIAEGARVVLYAPTHREYEPGHRPLLDLARFAESLGDGWVVLSRAHYYYESGQPIVTLARGRVVDVTGYDSVEELQLVADVLVTDYSSIMFDYGVLDRPIVIYAPDWETYQLLRGTYFDLMTEAPGPVCRTEDELAAVFASGAYDGDVSAKARQVFRQRFCDWDDGRAAERVVRRVFLGERPDLPGRSAA